jgi:hypothetical protein
LNRTLGDAAVTCAAKIDADILRDRGIDQGSNGYDKAQEK